MARVVKKNLYSFKYFIIKLINYTNLEDLESIKQKLELFTGSSNNPNWRPKVERAPLFSPLIGASNLYGDPVRTDEYKARYFPGNEKRNELPFQLLDLRVFWRLQHPFLLQLQ